MALPPEPPASPPPPWPNWEPLMRPALDQALAARDKGEVPIGAALFTNQGQLIATAGNAPISEHDPTAHAEIRCLRRAGALLNNYRLENTILAVTLEPCTMCLGALIHARVSGVIYGAADPRSGALDSCLPGPDLPFFNHRFWVISGVLAEECGGLLSDFFKQRRKAAQENS